MALFPDNPTTLVALIVGVMIAIPYLITRIMFAHDPREPPLAPQSIPFIGHLIGMSRRSFRYYLDLSQKTNAPIFTLPLPGQKMYVITKPELIQMVQKQHKTLAWPPITAKFSSSICGTSKETGNLMFNPDSSDDFGADKGMLADAFSAIHEALTPGAQLDDMNRSMINEVAKILDQLQPGPIGGASRKTTTTVPLFAWVRDLITIATTKSAYGPLNPYNDPAIVKSFWEYESGLISIIIGILPSVTARRPLEARERVAEALKAYYRSGGQERGSALTRNRYNVARKYGIPPEEIARLELGGSLAVMANTVPTAFWTFWFIFSDADLTARIRSEVDSCTRTLVSESGAVTKILDITTIKQCCPLLVSSYQEALRQRSMGISVRQVTQDTLLDGKWLLKKGSMVQMPTFVIHQDPTVWGGTCGEYNPRRFLAEEKHNRPRDTAFRGFGGGKTLCPGRHFATNEILASVALFVARFDVKPAAAGGKWEAPTVNNSNVAIAVMNPDYDVDVEVTTREGMQGVKWELTLEPSDKVFAMVTEDVRGEQE